MNDFKEIETKGEFNEIAKHSIGMRLEDFRALGYKFRVINYDGSACVVTCDFKPFRFNLTVVNNIITECHGG